MGWKDYSGDEHGYRELIKKHHPDAKVGRGHSEGVTQHTVGQRDTVVGHYDSHHKTGKVKVYEGTIMKKFSEFVSESKADHHEEGKSILQAHADNKTSHPDNWTNQHIVAVHKSKVDDLHKKLQSSGWKHHGIVAHGGHRYSKGGTSVDIDSKPEVDKEGHHGHDTHHRATVFTLGKKD